MDGMAKSVNGENLKKLRLKRIEPGREGVLPQNCPARYVQFLWVNPYLLFLIFILLLLSFSPPYQLVTYVLAEED